MVNTVLVCWLIDTACRTRATAWLNTEYGSIRYKCNIKNKTTTKSNVLVLALKPMTATENALPLAFSALNACHRTLLCGGATDETITGWDELHWDFGNSSPHQWRTVHGCTLDVSIATYAPKAHHTIPLWNAV